MRTTVTLDRDVAARLEQLARVQRQPFKAMVNEVLRAGLSIIERPASLRAEFRTTGMDLGVSKVGSLDDVAGALVRAESE